VSYLLSQFNCGTDAAGSGGGSVRSRGNSVKSALAVIERAASERGLSVNDIITLVGVVTSNKLRKCDKRFSVAFVLCNRLT